MIVKEVLFQSDNYTQIIKSLFFSKQLTISEISKQTGFSVPTSTKNVNELIQAGYLIEDGIGESNGGRKPIMYALVNDKAYIISVAMDQFFTKLSVVDMHGQLVTKITEVELDIKNDSFCVDVVVQHIKALIKISGLEKSKFCGIGLTMPGFINAEQGINYSFFEDGDVNIKEYLSTQTGLPVFMDNDSSSIALAELRFGRGKVDKEVMVINIGWGIGLGMIVKGEIFRGFSGFAGEFSHIPLFNNNKLCSCGKRGCLETEASLITLEDKATEAVKNGELTSMQLQNHKVSINTIIAEALKGDSFAIKLISESAYHIGRAIAVLIHIMNPQVIVISGKGIKAGKLWLAPLQQAINENCIPALAKNTEVVLSELGADSQLIGSAALVMENIGNASFPVRDEKEILLKNQLN